MNVDGQKTTHVGEGRGSPLVLKPVQRRQHQCFETEAYFPKYINLAMRGFPTTTKKQKHSADVVRFCGKKQKIVRVWCVFAR